MSGNAVVYHFPVVCNFVLLAVAIIARLLTMASTASVMETRAMHKRRELYDRVHHARALKELKDARYSIHVHGRKMVDVTPVYTYYNFLERFLGDRVDPLSVMSMRATCLSYHGCREARVNACMPVFLAFHDIIYKVLNNHVASTREQRKRLLREVRIAQEACRDVALNTEYPRFKSAVSALRKSIDESGTVRIQRKPVPSDVVIPYGSRVDV